MARVCFASFALAFHSAAISLEAIALRLEAIAILFCSFGMPCGRLFRVVRLGKLTRFAVFLRDTCETQAGEGPEEAIEAVKDWKRFLALS